MCQQCPGNFTFVQEKVGEGSSSLFIRSGSKNETPPKMITKKILRPCTCHCGSGPMEHMENGRAYCPACHHYLKM